MNYSLFGNNLDVIEVVTGGLFTFARVFTASDTLLKSPASILGSYIIAEGIGSMTLPSAKENWPLYIASMPDGSNVKTNCGALYDTTPVKDGRLMSGPVMEHQGLQLKIRCNNYETGYTKINSITSALDAVVDGEVTVSPYDYQIYNISRGSVTSLGLEPDTTKRRYLFTVNFLITIKKLDA